MAIILRAGNPPITKNDEVMEFLNTRGVEYNYWEINNPSAIALVAKATLTDDEKEALLVLLDDKFELLKKQDGYQSRDLVVLHPDVPGLDDMLAKFDKVHFHADVEVRYIVDGSGMFGFSLENGEKFLVQVFKNDFLSVPKGVNHWFYLDEKKRIKAVRYFQDTTGWTPNYVDEKASID